MQFTSPKSLEKAEFEEGALFAPKFNADGLITVVTIHAESKDVLMVAYMNEESLKMTIELGEAVYYSRSRQEIWHKGKTSGQVQVIKEILTDCDQDALVISVIPGGNGGCCHVGYENCFYRAVPIGPKADNESVSLSKTDVKKLSHTSR